MLVTASARRGRVLLSILAYFGVAVAASTMSGCSAGNALRELNGPLAGEVGMQEPESTFQLVSGFSAIESGVWRWTGPHFRVALQPPPNAATRGAKLQFQFRYPPASFTQMGTFTLSARVNGEPLAAERYTEAADYLFEREVPADVFPSNDPVIADFTLDRTASDGKRDTALVAIWFKLIPR